MNRKKSENSIIKNNKINEIELYRSLRTRIHLSKQGAKIISIISNDVNDGKSQVAYSLAKSYAKSGKKVLLLDGNLRNPQLSSDAKIDLDYGLSELLKGTGSIQNAIIKIDSQNLYLLPTQKAVSDSTELLERVILQGILEESKNMFEFIIVDTLAINDGMDALIISKLCDGAVYVTVENKTNENELRENKIIFDDKIRYCGSLSVAL